MLLISLALAALSPAAPNAEPDARVIDRAQTEALLRERCDARVRMVNGRMLSDSRPVETEAPVRMHYLLDNRVEGCSVPVIAVDTLPEADRSVGRVLGGPVER